MGLIIIMALASLLHSSIGSLINESTLYCPGIEVVYKCYPTSPFFQWKFELHAEIGSLAFANSPNGTEKKTQLKSISIRSVVTYDNAGLVKSTVRFIGHPDIDGATITCDGESTMYSLFSLLQPVIVLSIINESNCLEIKAIEDMLSNKLNYSVVVSTPYQNHVINWTTSNSVLCNYDIDLSYEFTVTNIDCPYSDPPVPSFYYSMRCPFFVRSIHQVSIEYNIYTQEGMSALILCADNTYLFMECGVDDMWQSNDSCSSNAETLASVNEIGNSYSKENGSEEDVKTYLLVFILIPVICLMLILILIVVLIIVMHKKLSRNKRKEERLDTFSNENEMAYQELSNAYRQGASAQAVQLSRYQAAISDEYSTINQVRSDPNYTVINKQEDLLQYDVVGQMYSIVPDDSNMAKVLRKSTHGELNNNKEEAYNCLEMGDDNEEDYAIQTDNLASNGVHQFSITPEGNDSTCFP